MPCTTPAKVKPASGKASWARVIERATGLSGLSSPNCMSRIARQIVRESNRPNRQDNNQGP